MGKHRKYFSHVFLVDGHLINTESGYEILGVIKTCSNGGVATGVRSKGFSVLGSLPRVWISARMD
jgi:hypothetical protein